MFEEQCKSESTAGRIRGERNPPSMHTVTDSRASKFMGAMPFGICTQNDQQWNSGVWHELSLSLGPVNLSGVSALSAWDLMPDPDHPHTCVHLGGAIIGRHDICDHTWYRGMQCAGMSVGNQPKNRHLQAQGHAPVPGSQRYGNRGDLLGVSQTRMVQLETFAHTTGMAGRTQGAHQEAGKSAKIREATKRIHHAKAGTSGYTYATLAHETHGRLGDEEEEQIRMLADEACSHASVHRSAFVGTSKLSLALLHSRAMPSFSSHAFARWPERRARRFKGRYNTKAYCHVRISGHVTAHRLLRLRPRHRARDPLGCDFCTVASGSQEMSGPAGTQSQLIDSEQQVEPPKNIPVSFKTEATTKHGNAHSNVAVILVELNIYMRAMHVHGCMHSGNLGGTCAYSG